MEDAVRGKHMHDSSAITAALSATEKQVVPEGTTSGAPEHDGGDFEHQQTSQHHNPSFSSALPAETSTNRLNEAGMPPGTAAQDVHGPTMPSCDNTGTAVLNLGGMVEVTPETKMRQGNNAATGLTWQFVASPHVQSAAAPFLSTPRDTNAPYLSPIMSPADWTKQHQYMPISANLHAVPTTGFFSPTGQPIAPVHMGDDTALWAELNSVVPGTPSMAAVPSRSPFITCAPDPTSFKNSPFINASGCVGDDSTPMKEAEVGSPLEQATGREGAKFALGSNLVQQEHSSSKQTDGETDQTGRPSGLNGAALHPGSHNVSDMNMSYLMNRNAPQYSMQQIDPHKAMGGYQTAMGMQLPGQGAEWQAAYRPMGPSQPAFLSPTNNSVMGAPGFLGRWPVGGNAGNFNAAGSIPMNYSPREQLEAAKALQSLDDERVWMDWEQGKLDGRLIDTVLHAKSLIEQMLNEFSVERASEVLRAAATLLGWAHQIDPPVIASGGAALPSVKLVHPDEFKNPSTFLQIYGDPLCFTKNGSLPKKGRNGNWECSKCSNVNFPRRFRCNMCSTTRDEEGDWVVCEYARQVYERYLSIYKNQQTSGQQASMVDGKMNVGGGGGVSPSPHQENSSTMSSHQDVLVPTSGAMGPGGDLFNFPVIGAPAQRPAVGVPQSQQHSHKQQNRVPNHNNSNGSSKYQQRQNGANNNINNNNNNNSAHHKNNGNPDPTIHSTMASNSGHNANIGIAHVTSSRPGYNNQNRRGAGHRHDAEDNRGGLLQNTPQTYTEIDSTSRSDNAALNGSNNNRPSKVPANFSSSRQGSGAAARGVPRNAGGGSSTPAAQGGPATHHKQQQPVA